MQPQDNTPLQSAAVLEYKPALFFFPLSLPVLILNHLDFFSRFLFHFNKFFTTLIGLFCKSSIRKLSNIKKVLLGHQTVSFVYPAQHVLPFHIHSASFLDQLSNQNSVLSRNTCSFSISPSKTVYL